ncbi:hypothetical protein D9M70_615610 [compost metagenome]
MLGVTDLVARAGLRHLEIGCLQLSTETILRAVRLVGDHHDVRTGRQDWETVLILPRHELLDGGEDDTATRAISQFLAQVSARGHLNRLFTEQILRQGKHAE